MVVYHNKGRGIMTEERKALQEILRLCEGWEPLVNYQCFVLLSDIKKTAEKGLSVNKVCVNMVKEEDDEVFLPQC
jgi:hypothetical protein